MKKTISIEKTALNYYNKVPSESFCNIISEQITVRLEELIDDSKLMSKLLRRSCLTIDYDWYMSDFMPSMKSVIFYISSKKAAFHFGKIHVFWKSKKDSEEKYPWDDISKDSIVFTVNVPRQTVLHIKEIMSVKNSVLF